MKTQKTGCCLASAAFPLLMALSFAAAAQEEEQQPQQQEEPQQLFVSDKLVLNVYAEANQSSERVATIETGDVVEALERAENFVRVRLEGGREGWVGANYLTVEPPAVARLRNQQREQKSAAQAVEKKSAAEIARLQKQNAALQAEVNDLQAKGLASPPAAGAVEMSAEQPAQSQAALQQELTAGNISREEGAPWIWPAFVLVAGGVGFLLGYQTLARRIRNKFGGLKLY